MGGADELRMGRIGLSQRQVLSKGLRDAPLGRPQGAPIPDYASSWQSVSLESRRQRRGTDGQSSSEWIEMPEAIAVARDEARPSAVNLEQRAKAIVFQLI